MVLLMLRSVQIFVSFPVIVSIPNLVPFTQLHLQKPFIFQIAQVYDLKISVRNELYVLSDHFVNER